MEDKEEVEDLKIKSIIGFDGTIKSGLIIHPDKVHLIYPLGNIVTIMNWNTKEQYFLKKHTNIISAIDVSTSGKYIASGQINHIGFKARTVIWSFDERRALYTFDIHKVRVEAIAFSKDDAYCISLGGRDCGSLVVWDMAKGRPLCGGEAAHGSQGDVNTLVTMKRRGACLLTAGDQHLALWKIDKEERNVRSIDIPTAKLKRTIVTACVNDRDEFCYCGTTTGDILKIRLNYHHDAEVLDPVKAPFMIGCFCRMVADKNERLYRQGVRTLFYYSNDLLLIGAGDGTLELVEEAKKPQYVDKHAVIKQPSIPIFKVLKNTNVHSTITSIQLFNKKTIFVGTTECEIFSVDLQTFVIELKVTCHRSTIYDVVFPYNFSEVFATASKHDVRIWSTLTMQEILRIRVPNFSCSALQFPRDGKSIVTAWNDGIIRSFTPLTGRLIYAILNAHNKGVSALAITPDDQMLITGGCEGQVRLWDVSHSFKKLICTLKEHKGPITEIQVNPTGEEAVSASIDGTCIIWDIVKRCRLQILFGTLFQCVRYYPSGIQLLTGGSDRKLAYWEVLDGSLVREIEGSPSGAINTLDISPDGTVFASGGNDQIVKLWRYQEGDTTHIGAGHSAVITSIRFSPNGKYIVSASGSGSIFLWECPFDVSVKEVKDEEPRNEEEESIEDAETTRSEPLIVDAPETARSEKEVKVPLICTCNCECPPERGCRLHTPNVIDKKSPSTSSRSKK